MADRRNFTTTKQTETERRWRNLIPPFTCFGNIVHLTFMGLT